MKIKLKVALSRKKILLIAVKVDAQRREIHESYQDFQANTEPSALEESDLEGLITYNNLWLCRAKPEQAGFT